VEAASPSAKRIGLFAWWVVRELKEASILVVEDNYHLRMLLDKILSDAGYSVRLAENGKEGLAQLDEATPDLILSDIIMPEMDGYEFYNAVRANPVVELVPFVFVSGKDAHQEILFGKSLGAEDYLTKPFRANELLVVIEARLERARRVQEAAREELQALRNHTVKMLNHELRTPLAVIKGYVDLALQMGDELDPATLAEYLGDVSQGVGRLWALIEDLLQLVEINGGIVAAEFVRRRERVEDLQPILNDLIEAYDSRAEQTGVKLRVRMPPSLAAIDGDRVLLADALNRLLDNAIKFSRRGGKVQVRAESNGGQVIIAITNYGRGIPAEEQPYVFDVFHQVDRVNYEQQGAGLGLPIAKALIELHGGHIEVENQDDRKCTFRVVLPAMADDLQP
jgi:signal transduction histidine kinase